MIGQSTEDEVLGVFEDIFGSTPDRLSTAEEWPIPGIHARRFQYYRCNNGYCGAFDGTAIFSTDSAELQLWEFEWFTADVTLLHVHLSPQGVIQQLGRPSHTFVTLGPGLEQLTLLVIYDNGIVFEYVNDMSLGPPTEPNSSFPQWEEYCFDDTEIQVQGSFIAGELYVLEPFDDGLENLSSLQAAILERTILSREPATAQDYFGIEQDMLIEQIMNEWNTCIRWDY